ARRRGRGVCRDGALRDRDRRPPLRRARRPESPLRPGRNQGEELAPRGCREELEMTEPRRDPWLLTPGPLTTSRAVKEAMLHDWGSRDVEFIKMNARVRERLVELAGGQGTHVCVPLQGSGTFIIEAMIGTLVPRSGKLAVLVNGAYGARMVRMCEYLRRDRVVLETPEDTPVDPAALDAALAADEAISHVAVVHCETTSGVLNPVEEIAGVTAGRGARDANNCRMLVGGLRALGFETLLPDALQAPIIVTVRMPADPKFNFESFYDRLSRRGFVIYPGKLTVADSFRIGCIGRLG